MNASYVKWITGCIIYIYDIVIQTIDLDLRNNSISNRMTYINIKQFEVHIS